MVTLPSLMCRKILPLLLLAGCSNSWGAPSGSWEAPPKVPRSIASLVKLEVITEKAKEPLVLTYAPKDTTGRLFVAEKGGKIRILRNGKFDPSPFLDLSKRVSGASEQGLLGLAFHPDYEKNGLFYVNFTDLKGDTRVVEFKVSSKNPDQADPSSERELLHLKQPYSNHNGGHLAFGPDGKLYIGTGDGGSANDPKNNGQNPTSLLGKMLRLDVDDPAAKPEIIQTGLRNPWRYSFDRKTGDLYIADVGQNAYEEINIVEAKKIGGQNFGWRIMEGLHCSKRAGSCDSGGMTLPAFEYSHKVGCSITGGYVYRGSAIPELDGVYFYADYCTGVLRSFRWKNGKIEDHWDWKPHLDPDDQFAVLASFGEDENGELYLLSLDGIIYKFVRASGM